MKTFGRERHERPGRALARALAQLGQRRPAPRRSRAPRPPSASCRRARSCGHAIAPGAQLLELRRCRSAARIGSRSGASCQPCGSPRQGSPRRPRAAPYARSRPDRARCSRSARRGWRSCAPSRRASRSSSRGPRTRPRGRSRMRSPPPATAAARWPRTDCGESFARRSRMRGSAVGERIDALARGAERVAVLGVVGLEPARSDPEHEAAAADVVDRARHVGVEVGVAVGVARDERAQARAAGRAGERGEQRHALEVRPRDVLAGTALEEVIPRPERVGADGLGGLGSLPDVVVGRAVGRNRGADSQGVRHGWIVAPIAREARPQRLQRAQARARARPRSARGSRAGRSPGCGTRGGGSRARGTARCARRPRRGRPCR